MRNVLISVSMTDNDRRLLILLLVLLVILVLILGLIGMLIRHLNKVFARRMDFEIHDGIKYGVITEAKALERYGRIKNHRVYFKQSLPPFIIALVSTIVFIVYALVIGDWGINHFERFGSLLFVFDWSNSDNYVQVFGVTLLAKWPEVVSAPTFVLEYWASYICVPLWIIAIVWFVIASQAFLCRALQLRKRCRTVFNKSLEGYNYYDHVNLPRDQKVPPNGGNQ